MAVRWCRPTHRFREVSTFHRLGRDTSWSSTPGGQEITAHQASESGCTMAAAPPASACACRFAEQRFSVSRDAAIASCSAVKHPCTTSAPCSQHLSGRSTLSESNATMRKPLGQRNASAAAVHQHWYAPYQLHKRQLRGQHPTFSTCSCCSRCDSSATRASASASFSCWDTQSQIKPPCALALEHARRCARVWCAM